MILFACFLDICPGNDPVFFEFFFIGGGGDGKVATFNDLMSSSDSSRPHD